MSNLSEILHTVQKQLKAPKNQKNTFGNYNYRSCEDILEGVKKILPEGVIVLLNDEIVQVGDRFYVKATAAISDGKSTLQVSAYARESLDKKGMDVAQITGATSSYARKYALNGLFLIDDTKDIDTMDNKDTKPEVKQEYTRENKLMQRDFMYGLSKQTTAQDVQEWLDAYKEELEKNPHITGALLDAANSRIEGLKKGVVFPKPVYGFIDVEEALAFAKIASANIEAGPSEGLDSWMIENDDQIKALDLKLNAEKYNKGGKPSERLFKLYEERNKA